MSSSGITYHWHREAQYTIDGRRLDAAITKLLLKTLARNCELRQIVA